MKPIPLRISTNHTPPTRAAQREQNVNYLSIALLVAVTVWFFAAWVIPDAVIR